MMLHELHLLRPWWLLALLPMVLMLWRLLRSGGEGDAWRDLIDAHLLPSLLTTDTTPGSRLPLWLLSAGWLLGVVALAGPTWQRLPVPVFQAEQYRVVALDLSPSMNAADLKPSRLAQARFAVLDLLRLADEGQTALLAYGAEPFVVSPLTADAATIAAQVPSLATDLLPVGGDRRTDLVLAKAGELLHQAGAPDGDVILITDGVDNPGAAAEAAGRLRADGYRVSVLGVGTDKGAPVVLADGGFAQDAQGGIALARLDIATLRTLAKAGGGSFASTTTDSRAIERLVGSNPSRATQQASRQDVQADQWREEGPWLLLLVLPLAALAFRRGWLSPLLLLVFLVPVPPAHAFDWNDLWLRADQQASRKFAAGQAADAAAQFERPDWRAAAHYRAGDYAQAAQTLQGLPDADAAYNSGNALARSGALEQALAAFDRALAARPDDADARHNRDLVQQLIDQRRQQDNQGSEDKQKSGDKRESAGQQPGQGEQDQGAGGQEKPGQGEQTNGSDGHDPAQTPDQPQPTPSSGADGGAQDVSPFSAGNPQDTPENTGAQDRQAGSDASDPAKPSASEPAQTGPAAPGLSDLLGDAQGQAARGIGPVDAATSEDAQAMEQMLRRVEDDPGGLLRQRFLLQHLRRTGRLP